MKKLFFLLLPFTAFSQNKQQFVSTDIANFWRAYEQINSTKDSSLQYKLFQELYVDKGTAGLKGLMEVRNYSAKEFIAAITSYPRFWHSLKGNTLKAKDHYATIEAELKPGRRYQILISNNFRKKDGVSLKPYLIDITTTVSVAEAASFK